MKIIIATDFHLSYRQYGLVEREKDFYNKFNKLIEEVIKEKPLIFIELGDIFHTPQPKPIAMRIFRDGIQKLKENGIRCYGIIGNHTTVKTKNYYPVDYLFKEIGLEIINNSYVYVDDVFIGGIGYHSPSDNIRETVDMLYEKATFYNPRFKVLLLHQGLKKDIPLGYDFDEDELGLNRFDYVFLGHFHKRLLRKEEGTAYHYVGSLNSCNIVELEEEEQTGKGYTVFDTGTGEIIMKTIPTVRHYLQYDVNSDELNDKTVNEMTVSLGDYSVKPLVCLKIRGNNTKGVYEMLETMQDGALHIKYEKVQQEPVTTADVRLDDQKTTIQELMMEHFEEERTGKFAYELFKLLKEDKVEEALELSDKELEKDETGLGHMGDI